MIYHPNVGRLGVPKSLELADIPRRHRKQRAGRDLLRSAREESFGSHERDPGIRGGLLHRHYRWNLWRGHRARSIRMSAANQTSDHGSIDDTTWRALMSETIPTVFGR